LSCQYTRQIEHRVRPYRLSSQPHGRKVTDSFRVSQTSKQVRPILPPEFTFKRKFTVKPKGFWSTMLRQLLNIYRRFGASCCLLLYRSWIMLQNSIWRYLD